MGLQIGFWPSLSNRISLVSISCSAYMIIATVHEILGTLFSGDGLAPLVGNFLRDTRSHHNESKS